MSEQASCATCKPPACTCGVTHAARQAVLNANRYGQVVILSIVITDLKTQACSKCFKRDKGLRGRSHESCRYWLAAAALVGGYLQDVQAAKEGQR